MAQLTTSAGRPPYAKFGENLFKRSSGQMDEI